MYIASFIVQQDMSNAFIHYGIFVPSPQDNLHIISQASTLPLIGFGVTDHCVSSATGNHTLEKVITNYFKLPSMNSLAPILTSDQYLLLLSPNQRHNKSRN